jgi:hypothetical protein
MSLFTKMSIPPSVFPQTPLKPQPVWKGSHDIEPHQNNKASGAITIKQRKPDTFEFSHKYTNGAAEEVKKVEVSFQQEKGKIVQVLKQDNKIARIILETVLGNNTTAELLNLKHDYQKDTLRLLIATFEALKTSLEAHQLSPNLSHTLDYEKDHDQGTLEVSHSANHTFRPH